MAGSQRLDQEIGDGASIHCGYFQHSCELSICIRLHATYGVFRSGTTRFTSSKVSPTPQIPQLIHSNKDRLLGSITLKQGCCNQSMPWYRKGGKSEITRSPCRYQLSAGSRSAESHRGPRPHATCRSWPKSARRSSRGPLPPAKSSGRQPPGPPGS